VKPVRLLCATANPAKLREFQLAAGERVSIEGMAPVPCPEHGSTFEENACSKALCYSLSIAPPRKEAEDEPLVFADDSGLAVDVLGGAPGVYSARFAGPDAADEANNALVLEKLRGVSEERRTARFVCVIALAQGDRILRTFRGEAEGRILEAPAGQGGFGYDPLFFFSPLGKTFAELGPKEKWRHSHRGKAFRALIEWLSADEASGTA